MKVVIIGGTGHIGSFLTPWLVRKGHQVTSISRNISHPYVNDDAWQQVTQLQMDRKAEEKAGHFGKNIAALHADIVIDLICFDLRSAQHLVEALNGHVSHFLHCGTMWVHGHSIEVPTRETQARNPFGAYGIKKAKIENYLLESFEESKFPVTILHPGHITGPGWLPINPAGNLNPKVFLQLAKGEKVQLPNLGMETLHHIHAMDVAQAFVKSIEHFNKAIGESFHVVAEQAITLRGFAEEVAKWFGKEAKIEFLPFQEWATNHSAKDAQLTWDHIAHSPNGSTEKAKRMLFFKPDYTAMEAVKEALNAYLVKKHPTMNLV